MPPLPQLAKTMRQIMPTMQRKKILQKKKMRKHLLTQNQKVKHHPLMKLPQLKNKRKGCPSWQPFVFGICIFVSSAGKHSKFLAQKALHPFRIQGFLVLSVSRMNTLFLM
ncbi:MAG TPA: hypothetical protein PLP40_08165 [Trichococcus flocculiformis]|nr:hypothetical protein [Trichococcus flocculiformis]